MENTTQSATETTGAKKKGGGTKLIAALVIIVALGVAGYLYYTKMHTADTTSTLPPVAVAILGNGSGPVARVNGVEIPWSDYTNSVVSIVNDAQAQGADLTASTTQDQVREQALTTLINTQLLLQDASANNIAATDDQVNTQYNQIVTQVGGADALKAQLITYNLTDEELRANIKTQITINALLTAKIDPSQVTVSEDEIAAFYKTLSDNAQGTSTVPDLETIRPQIEQQLQSQKEQALVGDYVNSLREKATIEELI